MTPRELVNEIMAGTYDKSLDGIATVIRQRKDRIERLFGLSNLILLKRGDLVKIRPNTKPTHIRGLNGQVLRVGKRNVLVELDNGLEYHIPAAGLLKIEPQLPLQTRGEADD
jgi:hypothetical protein